MQPRLAPRGLSIRSPAVDTTGWPRVVIDPPALSPASQATATPAGARPPAPAGDLSNHPHDEVRAFQRASNHAPTLAELHERADRREVLCLLGCLALAVAFVLLFFPAAP